MEFPWPPLKFDSNMAEEKAEAGKDCDLSWLSYLVGGKIGIWTLNDFPLTFRGKQNKCPIVLF